MNTVSVEILKDLYYIGVNDRDTNLFENAPHFMAIWGGL